MKDIKKIKEEIAKGKIKEEDRTKCGKCGQIVSKNWNYCTNCGAEITSD